MSAQRSQEEPVRKKQPKHPLEKSYGISLSVAIFALVPFIIVTTAFELFRKGLGQQLGIGDNALALISAMATAGYAFGALFGGDIIQRFPQRRLFFICETLFVIGCALAMSAAGTVTLGSGMVLLGLATGLLLVIALPPVIQRFPAQKLPITTAVVNLGFFGATTIGPLLGGVIAYGQAWRWFYGGLTALGIAVLATSYFTLPEQDPPKPDLRFDWPAIGLALASAVLPFIASGQLTGHSFGSYWFMVPLAIGLACLVTMLLVEYHQKEPLSPVKMMWHTLPLVGTLTAMIGGGAFITFLMLAERYEIDVLGRGALATGFSFWPQVIGVVVTAVLLGLLIRTRYLPVLALCGMLLLVGAGLILLQLGGGGSRALLLSAAGLLGLGAGATVSPGLWIAGMALPSKMVGRTFALVELVRSEADFLLGPVLLEVAQMWSGGGKKLTGAGFHHAVWVTLLVTAATTAFMVVLYLIGGVKLEVPNLEAWLKENKPAFGSPPLAATLRNAGGGKKAA